MVVKYSRESLRALAKEVRKRKPSIDYVTKRLAKAHSLYDDLIEEKPPKPHKKMRSLGIFK
jgi:hypothetical protein